MENKPLDVGIPEGMSVEENRGELVISRKWFSPMFIFLIFFCVFWNGFLVFWYSAALSSGNLIMILFPIIHVAVGLGLIYFTVAGFLNTTTIRVNARKLSVEHAPLPWIGAKELLPLDIKQLYAKEKIHNSQNGSRVSYDVHAILHNRKNVKLLSGLQSSEQALFIEQEIERFLLIEDSPVKGELK